MLNGFRLIKKPLREWSVISPTLVIVCEIYLINAVKNLNTIFQKPNASGGNFGG